MKTMTRYSAVLALCLAAAACGGGGGSTSTNTNSTAAVTGVATPGAVSVVTAK